MFQYKQWCIQVDQGLLPLGLLKLAKEKEATEAAKRPRLAKIPEGAECGDGAFPGMSQVLSENGVKAKGETNTRGNVQNKSNGKGKGRQKVKASTSSQSSLNENLHRVAFSQDFQVPVSATTTSAEARFQQNNTGGSEANMDISEFISDLSKFSTIGVNNVDSEIARNTNQQVHRKLDTISEESIEQSSGILNEKGASLIPTFVEDLAKD